MCFTTGKVQDDTGPPGAKPLVYCTVYIMQEVCLLFVDFGDLI